MGARQLFTDLALGIESHARAGRTLTIDRDELFQAILDALETIEITQHPLGFYHFELTSLAGVPDMRLRFHLWSRRSFEGRDELGLIHEHTWDLASCVLLGELTDVVLEAHEDPIGGYRRVVVDYGNDTLEQDSGAFDVREVDRRIVRNEGTYFLPAGKLHMTNVERFPTATAVVARETGRRTAAIFSEKRLSHSRGTDREPVSVEAAARELEHLLE